VAVVSGAAEPTAVAGGKDYLRSAALLAGQQQQLPTANSETFTSPRCCPTSRRLLLFNVVNEKSLRITILRPSAVGGTQGNPSSPGLPEILNGAPPINERRTLFRKTSILLQRKLEPQEGRNKLRCIWWQLGALEADFRS
jgi:hypothetical protein